MRARRSRAASGRARVAGRLPHRAARRGRRARAPTRPGPSSAPRSKNSIATASTGASPSPRTGRASPPACGISSCRARSNLALDGPLGIGGLRVELEGEDLEIATSRGEKLDGDAARAELERRLGFALPLAELRWWLLGIPAPGEASVDQDAGQRRDPRLHAERLAA